MVTPERPNRLTRIGDRLTAALRADEEYRAGDKTIIIMHDAAEGGTTLDGYDIGDWEAADDLYKELNRIASYNGARLLIITKDDN